MMQQPHDVRMMPHDRHSADHGYHDHALHHRMIRWCTRQIKAVFPMECEDRILDTEHRHDGDGTKGDISGNRYDHNKRNQTTDDNHRI